MSAEIKYLYRCAKHDTEVWTYEKKPLRDYCCSPSKKCEPSYFGERVYAENVDAPVYEYYPRGAPKSDKPFAFKAQCQKNRTERKFCKSKNCYRCDKHDNLFWISRTNDPHLRDWTCSPDEVCKIRNINEHVGIKERASAIDLVSAVCKNRTANGVGAYNPEIQIKERPVVGAYFERVFKNTLDEWKDVTASYAASSNSEEWLAQNEKFVIRICKTIIEFQSKECKSRQEKGACMFVVFEILLSIPACFFTSHPKFVKTAKKQIPKFIGEDARYTEVCRDWSARLEMMLA